MKKDIVIDIVKKKVVSVVLKDESGFDVLHDGPVVQADEAGLTVLNSRGKTVSFEWDEEFQLSVNAGNWFKVQL